MGKPKAVSPEKVEWVNIVVWWDGFNQEHQGTDKGGEEPVQWEFTEEEAKTLCRRQIKRGAIRAEVWVPGAEPLKVASYERTASGDCRQNYPRR